MVKVKAKQCALKYLKTEQGKHSKMKNLEYNELKLQPYFILCGLKIEQARNIFKFRTRMTPLGENFRSNREYVFCPLCFKALDNQEHCFKCEILKAKININCEEKDIYKGSITIETTEIVTEILEARIEELNGNKDYKNGIQITGLEAQVHQVLSAASNMYCYDLD